MRVFTALSGGDSLDWSSLELVELDRDFVISNCPTTELPILFAFLSKVRYPRDTIGGTAPS
jgi:hypothetical protein